jgi:capsular polysaccharide biosynthesis protein
MELRQYTAALLKWWWLIVASVAIATVSSFLGTRATPPTYVSRTTIMVGQALQNPDPSQSDLYTGQALAQTYADLAKREPVLRGTLAAFGLTCSDRPAKWSPARSYRHAACRSRCTAVQRACS